MNAISRFFKRYKELRKIKKINKCISMYLKERDLSCLDTCFACKYVSYVVDKRERQLARCRINSFAFDEYSARLGCKSCPYFILDDKIKKGMVYYKKLEKEKSFLDIEGDKNEFLEGSDKEI